MALEGAPYGGGVKPHRRDAGLAPTTHRIRVKGFQHLIHQRIQPRHRRQRVAAFAGPKSRSDTIAGVLEKRAVFRFGIGGRAVEAAKNAG